MNMKDTNRQLLHIKPQAENDENWVRRALRLSKHLKTPSFNTYKTDLDCYIEFYDYTAKMLIDFEVYGSTANKVGSRAAMRDLATNRYHPIPFIRAQYSDSHLPVWRWYVICENDEARKYFKDGWYTEDEFTSICITISRGGKNSAA